MYARMCVEIDLKAPLLPSYCVDGNHLKIEYEGLHMVCFHYGKFGHDEAHCPLKITPQGDGRAPGGNAPATAGPGGQVVTPAAAPHPHLWWVDDRARSKEERQARHPRREQKRTKSTRSKKG